MEHSIAPPLDELASLEADLCYLFVAGPGYGEGIALAFPGRGWLLVDGCSLATRPRKLPLAAILDRSGRGDDDPVLGMVLTHPHQDHVGGFVDILHREQPGFVALTGLPPNRHIAREVEALADVRRHGSTVSVVLDVALGDSSLVLGADLPATEGGSRVDTGWHRVLEDYPELAAHAAAKIPHHGSREALHHAFLAGEGSKAWVLTPFNSSSLPRTDDDDGLDILLEHQDSIMLTAQSLSKAYQAAWDDGRVTRPELAVQTSALRADGLFDAGDTILRAGTAKGPLDAVWTLAFDAHGAPVGRGCGPAAREVHRSPPT